MKSEKFVSKSKFEEIGDVINLEETDKKQYVLSIVNLISLAEEQQKSFKSLGDVNLISYKDKDFIKYKNTNLVICINSLWRLQNVEEKNFKNYILYIDEINSLMNTLTHNKTLDIKLNIIYLSLMKLIKNCKKIILTDAIINENVFNLLSTRKKIIKQFL
jgi:hypothetical protein